HRDVALRSEVVDLVGLCLLDDADEARRIGHIAVVQDEVARLVVRILVEVVDAIGIEERAAPLDAVHHVALGEQQLGEIGAVLAGKAGDERNLGAGGGAAREPGRIFLFHSLPLPYKSAASAASDPAPYRARRARSPACVWMSSQP